jgi:hypothetical protein
MIETTDSTVDVGVEEEEEEEESLWKVSRS